MTLLAPAEEALISYNDIYDELVYDILEATEPPEAARELRELRASGHPNSQLKALYSLPVAAYVKSMAAGVKTKDAAIKVWMIITELSEIVNKSDFFYDLFCAYDVNEFDGLPDDVLAYGMLFRRRVSKHFEGPRHIEQPIEEFILVLYLLAQRRTIISNPCVTQKQLGLEAAALKKYVSLAVKLIKE
jgi:hypothetical protein